MFHRFERFPSAEIGPSSIANSSTSTSANSSASTSTSANSSASTSTSANSSTSTSTSANFSTSASASANSSTSASASANSSASTSSSASSSWSAEGSEEQIVKREEVGRDLLARLKREVRVNERVLYPDLSHAIVGAAIEVHRYLGPGKLESTYQRALDEELTLRGIAHRGQVPIALRYKGRDVGTFVLDFVVEDKIVVELKAVDRQHPVHRAQLLSYLHATTLRLGLLINFNVPALWRGVQRVVL